MSRRLHEREAESQIIVAALDAAGAGVGRLLVVEGPAGIGKSSLLEVAREAAQARGFATGHARGSDLETAYAWGVVRQLFESRLRGMSVQTRRATLGGAAALAAPVVLPDVSGPNQDVDASFGVFHGLYWLVAALAARRRELLVVDDLQWADPASVRFLEFLANRIDTLPVLLVVARRASSGAASVALAGAPSAERIDLAPLSRDATAAVLAERDGAAASPAFVAACHDATGGNPFLLRRLADGLGDRGVDGVGDDDVGAVTRLGPDALAAAVAAALARVGHGPDRLARAVAVLDRAPLVTAARLAGLDPSQASAHAEPLVRAGILRDARPLEFEHALVRDAVESGLSAGERAALHANAARILSATGAAPDAVAVHLLHAEPGGDDAVAVALAEAGRRALASGAPSEAVAFLTRALAEPPPAGERSALLLDLGRAENGLARPEALDRVVAAFEAAGDDVERARAALGLMWASGPGHQAPEEALAMIERAIEGVAGRHRELELELQAARLMAIFMSPALLMETLGEAERFADLPGATVGECQLLLHVAIHRLLGGGTAADVAGPCERAVADPALVAAIGPESAWQDFVIGGLYKADRLDAARRTVAVALAEARRRGSAPGFAAASMWRAWIDLRAGTAAGAEADARAAHRLVPVGMWQHVRGASCLVQVLIERGRLDEARAVLEAAGGADATASDAAGSMLLASRSMLRAAEGDARGGLADQLAARGARDGSPDPDFDGWLRIALLLHATGDTASAAREAEQALAWARVWGTPGYVGQALTVSGLVTGGDDGLALLRDGVAHLERSPARFEHARALVDLGAALRRRGERVAAREPLRRALDLAASGGLLVTAERAREELRVTGARVRRAESTGIASLTPSERRIVDLAAGGASNPEIAQALFVTVKTVEMHLGNAYRKLGISSRRDLASLVASLKSSGANTGASP
jgi:DNA-binding CsgD family transcriptional regulator